MQCDEWFDLSVLCDVCNNLHSFAASTDTSVSGVLSCRVDIQAEATARLDQMCSWQQRFSEAFLPLCKLLALVQQRLMSMATGPPIPSCSGCN